MIFRIQPDLYYFFKIPKRASETNKIHMIYQKVKYLV